MTTAQLQVQRRIIMILIEQNITNFYLAHNGNGHAFYSHSSDDPLFVTTSSVELMLLFATWCHGTPNEDVEIAVVPF